MKKLILCAVLASLPIVLFARPNPWEPAPKDSSAGSGDQAPDTTGDDGNGADSTENAGN